MTDEVCRCGHGHGRHWASEPYECQVRRSPCRSYAGPARSRTQPDNDTARKDEG